MIEFVNLTSHDINIVDLNGRAHTFHSKGLARLEVISIDSDPIANFGVKSEEEIGIEGLPDPFPNRIYIVSSQVMLSAKRQDVVSPGELIRETGGNVTGCYGFSSYKE